MAMTLSNFFDPSGYEKEYHPVAIENYRQFLDDINKDVPPDTLTDEDLKAFLSDWDYWLYQDAVKTLMEWLGKCLMSNDESTLSVYPGSFPTLGTSGLKSALLKASQEKHLREMIATARKRREAEAMRAQSECNQYLMGIRSAIMKFKHDLTLEKKPEFSYPAALADYQPESWCNLQSPKAGMVKEWAAPVAPAPLAGGSASVTTCQVLFSQVAKWATDDPKRWERIRNALLRIYTPKWECINARDVLVAWAAALLALTRAKHELKRLENL